MSAYLCPGKKEKPISSALLTELGWKDRAEAEKEE